MGQLNHDFDSDTMEDQDKLSQFVAITGANQNTVSLEPFILLQPSYSPQFQAQGALQAANGNLEQAISLFYAQQEEPEDDDDEQAGDNAAQPTPAQPSSSHQHSSNPTGQRRPPGQRPKQMTLGDLQRENAESDDEDERDRYAGGEKSGLAVENPNKPADHFNRIMNQAKQNRDRPGGDDEEEERQPARPSAFAGRAQTLGGEGEESRVIEDPTARTQGPGAAAGGRQRLPRVTRTMHLWADGVSIDDGPLFRFDDPANQDMMAQINQGRAPLSLLDVQPDQEVDLNLDPHQGENFVQPKKKYKPFSGSGQRLGSPTPGAASSSAAAAPPPAASAQPAAASASSGSATGSKPNPQMNVDESQPTIQLQIRLGDGTRLSSRFNTTHTVGDVYGFVDRASVESTQRSYALMTTFPSKELLDRGVALGEMGEFKRGGVVVQKWK